MISLSRATSPNPLLREEGFLAPSLFSGEGIGGEVKIRTLTKRIVFYLITYVSFGFSDLKAQNNGDIYSKKYTYQTLSPYEKQLFDEFLADEIPASVKVESVLTDHTSLRSKTRVAEALLFRNAVGDKENAVIVLQWILKNQHQDENTKIYGIWKTAITNDKFDQNWREFIGCDLIIIRNKFRHLLPENIVKDIEIGLVHAAKGAFKRNVAPDYTNISIMSAFLMEYVGTEFKMEDIKNAGLKKARDIFKLYQTNKTFSEFNSPTYYGVTTP